MSTPGLDPLKLDILEFARDPNLAGEFFRVGDWRAWFAALAAIFALPITSPGDLELYRRCTGRELLPGATVREAWLVVGRRGGNSRIAALIAVFLAVAFTLRKRAIEVLAPGELATVMVLAADRKQARVVMRYVEGMVRHVPLIAGMVKDQTKEAITIGRVVIEVHSASFRSVRGYSVEDRKYKRDSAAGLPARSVL